MDNKKVPDKDDCLLKSDKSPQISTLMILIFCFLGATLLLFCYYMILRKYSSNLLRRRRSLSQLENTHQDLLDENHGPVVDHPIWLINTIGLQESIIESITVFKYKKNEALVEGTECSVCLAEFQEDEDLRLLPKCSHAFHIPCIDTWLRSHKNCPLCRAPVVCENARVSALEPNLDELGSIEETRLENLEDHGGESSELRVGAEETKIDDNLERNTHKRNREVRVLSLSDLANVSVKVDEELQPVRRSISMDSSSASMIYLAVANEGCSDTQMVQAQKPNAQVVTKKSDGNSSFIRAMKSCSFGSSLQKGPTSMKRSFSSSGKWRKNGYSKSHESILPM